MIVYRPPVRPLAKKSRPFNNLELRRRRISLRCCVAAQPVPCLLSRLIASADDAKFIPLFDQRLDSADILNNLVLSNTDFYCPPQVILESCAVSPSWVSYVSKHWRCEFSMSTSLNLNNIPSGLICKFPLFCFYLCFVVFIFRLEILQFINYSGLHLRRTTNKIGQSMNKMSFMIDLTWLVKHSSKRKLLSISYWRLRTKSFVLTHVQYYIYDNVKG